jgi:RimJ/RimL family protein N-acetyltransferase
VILSRSSGALIGSTGLSFETPTRAATGYALAKGAWGQGYATEALREMVRVAAECGVCRLYALCHHAHRASAQVLEKGGFALEGTLRCYGRPQRRPLLLEDSRKRPWYRGRNAFIICPAELPHSTRRGAF